MPLAVGAAELKGLAVLPVRPVEFHARLLDDPRHEVLRHALLGIDLDDQVERFGRGVGRPPQARHGRHDAEPVVVGRRAVLDRNPWFARLVDRPALALEVEQRERRCLQRLAQRRLELVRDDAAAHAGYFFVPSSIALIRIGQYSLSKPSSLARSISSRATSAPSAGTPASSAIWIA